MCILEMTNTVLCGNKGDILVAFRSEKSDVGWSKAIMSLISPFSVIPGFHVMNERITYLKSELKIPKVMRFLLQN